MIWMGLTLGGIIGAYLGSLLDNGNYLGGFSIFFGTLGSLAGVYLGYKAGKQLF